MDGSLPPTPHASPPQRPRRRRAWALGVLASGILASGALAAPLQEGTRPDKVSRIHQGKVSTLSGTVTENSLQTVRIDRAGKKTAIDAAEVLRIEWGEVPPAYRDGRTYQDRGDHENAVARFRIAAGDASARGVVRADSRLRAAEALLAWGAVDANRYGDCVTEAERFLTDYPSNRRVPRARWIKARAIQLGGDVAGAAAAFRALYEEGASAPPTTGYDRSLCLDAGLEAAEAFLASGDTATARELFTALEVAFGQAADAVDDPASPARAHLLAGRGVASVGEGFCLLAGGQASQAVRFFEGRLGRSDATASARYAATLGLAEAHAATGLLRQAQVEFAKVSALDHTDRDRVARALVGLADTSIKLNDSDARASARLWLTKVTELYGDTPAASQAAELLKKL